MTHCYNLIVAHSYCCHSPIAFLTEEVVGKYGVLDSTVCMFSGVLNLPMEVLYHHDTFG
jgi:hypothetical protein